MYFLVHLTSLSVFALPSSFSWQTAPESSDIDMSGGQQLLEKAPENARALAASLQEERARQADLNLMLPQPSGNQSPLHQYVKLAPKRPFTRSLSSSSPSSSQSDSSSASDVEEKASSKK